MKHILLVFGSTALIAGSAHAQLRLIDQDYKPPIEKAAVPAAQTRPQVVAAPVRASVSGTPQAPQAVAPVLPATPSLNATAITGPRLSMPTPLPAPVSFALPPTAGFAASVKRTKVDTFVLVKLFLLLPHAGAIEEKPFKTMT